MGRPTKASGTGSFQYYFQMSPVEEHCNRLSFLKNQIKMLKTKSHSMYEGQLLQFNKETNDRNHSMLNNG